MIGSRMHAAILAGAIALTALAVALPNGLAGTATRVVFFLAVPGAFALELQRWSLRERSRTVALAATAGALLLLTLAVGAAIVASPWPISRDVLCSALAMPTLVWSAIGASRTPGRGRHHRGEVPSDREFTAPRRERSEPQRRRPRPGAVAWLAAALVGAIAVGTAVWSQAGADAHFVQLGETRLARPPGGDHVAAQISVRRQGSAPARYQLLLVHAGSVLRTVPIDLRTHAQWNTNLVVPKRSAPLRCLLVEPGQRRHVIRTVVVR